MTFSFETLGLN